MESKLSSNKICIVSVFIRLFGFLWFLSLCSLVLLATYVSFDWQPRYAKVEPWLLASAAMAISPIIGAVIIGLVNWMLFGFEGEGHGK